MASILSRPQCVNEGGKDMKAVGVHAAINKTVINVTVYTWTTECMSISNILVSNGIRSSTDTVLAAPPWMFPIIFSSYEWASGCTIGVWEWMNK